jgi:FKBP-type peptidyl-prolyl cis-trans isomerase
MKTPISITVALVAFLFTTLACCNPVREPPDPTAKVRVIDANQAKPISARPIKPIPKKQIERRVAAKPEPIPAPADVAAPPAEAKKTASGLASKVLKAGPGKVHPTADDTVRVHYTGWTTDGKMFDSSISRGQPISFPLRGVISGWTEGVQLMVEGEKRRFWIPEELAYKGKPGAPAGMLVFDVELLQIVKQQKATRPEPQPAPPDVAAAPANAARTASGLASTVLKAGDGKVRPNPEDTVKVHYSGWTTDGKMFDSSVSRGRPAVFRLNQVIPGWTEGVGLMVEGEKRRLWIPEEMAYKGRQGAPQGMLVFDVELIKIVQMNK